MKKTLLSTILLAMAITASADGTFSFVNSTDNSVYADEASVTISTAYGEDDGLGGTTVYMPAEICVQNNSDEVAAVGLYITISKISGGSLSCCFPTNCSAQTSTVSNLNNGSDIMQASELRDLHTNFFPTAAGDQCVVTFTLAEYEVVDGKIPTVGDFSSFGDTLNVTFAFDGTINGIDTPALASTAQSRVYNLAGQRVSSTTYFSGVQVVDGKKIIKLNK